MILELDFETTGICEQRCGIIEIGARWHTDHGQRRGEFFRECRPHPDCLIEQGALNVNGYTKERILDPKRMTEAQAIVELLGFIRGGVPDLEIKVQIAAWNAPFEARHFRAATERAHVSEQYWGIRHSYIDPQAILTADLIRGYVKRRAVVPEGGVLVEDNALPEPHRWGGLFSGGDEAAAILGIPVEEKPHNALRGARQVHRFLVALGIGEAEAA